jgi:hypothetical protein
MSSLVPLADAPGRGRFGGTGHRAARPHAAPVPGVRMMGHQHPGALLERLLPVVAAYHSEKAAQTWKVTDDFLASEQPEIGLAVWLADLCAACREVTGLIEREWIDARLLRALARVKKCEAKVSRCQERVAARLAA